MRISHSISALNKRPWIALAAMAIFHLIVTLSVFSVGRNGWAPGQFSADGIGEFARDSRLHQTAVNELVDGLKQGQIRAWFASPYSLHIKAYSLSVLPMGFLFGSSILAVEPLNIFYYLAILTLTFCLGKLVAGERAAWLAALTVAFWPSLLLHTTQFLRDPLLLVGFLALISILVMLLKENFNWRWTMGATVAGAASIYVVLRNRPAISLVIAAIAFTSALLLVIKMISRRQLFTRNLLVIAALIVVTFSLNRVPGAPPKINEIGPREPRVPSAVWSPIANARHKFIRDGGITGSTVDGNVYFASATDIVRYVPRALEIGYLAPFPSMWLQTGDHVGRVGRLLSGFEMMLTYMFEVFACIFFWRNRKHFSPWLLVLTTAIGALTLGLVVINIGTLYRMRYPFWILLVIMGAGSIARLQLTRAPAASKPSIAEANPVPTN